jgi:hypothetical protein
MLQAISLFIRNAETIFMACYSAASLPVARRDIGKAAEMEQRLMDLYFTEGADLTNRAVLYRACWAAG